MQVNKTKLVQNYIPWELKGEKQAFRARFPMEGREETRSRVEALGTRSGKEHHGCRVAEETSISLCTTKLVGIEPT